MSLRAAAMAPTVGLRRGRPNLLQQLRLRMRDRLHEGLVVGLSVSLLGGAVGAFGAGCAHTSPAATPAASARRDGQRPRITSDEEYARGRADYDEQAASATEPKAATARAALRTALATWELGEARLELIGGRPDEASGALLGALSLWDVESLRPAAADPAVVAAAADLERLYRRRGAHKEVLALIALESALAPGDTAIVDRFDEVVRWVRGGRDGALCADKSCQQVIEDLEYFVMSLPAPLVVDRLAGLYWMRQGSSSALAGEGVSALSQLLGARNAARSAYDLARLHLRVSRPDLAVAALEKIKGQTGDDEQLRNVLSRYASAEAKPIDAVALASAFARDAAGRPTALRICRDAELRFPAAFEPAACTGETANLMGRTGEALRAWGRALELNPDRKESWEVVARLQLEHLRELVTNERTDDLAPALDAVERFYAAARKRFPDQPLRTSLGAAFDTAARGFYNGGRVDDALQQIDRSVAEQPSVSAYEQRANIELKRDRPGEAVARYQVALGYAAGRQADTGEQAYWTARLERGLGDAEERAGHAAEATSAWKKSLEAYELLLTGRLEPEARAELEVERGKLLFLLGDETRARESFETAVDAAPERGSTYADTLAFLIPRGAVEPATAIYHRALGRSISEYLKVYASLWLVDLDRRLGRPVDSAALDYLGREGGTRWYHRLAAYMVGKLSEDALRAEAATPGQRAEADFYVGLRRLEEGHASDGRALLDRVLASRLMAFFEYDMAGYLLRHPAASEKAAAR